MSTRLSPHPDEPDVHLVVVLGGVRLDFAVCRTAALNFIIDHRHHHYVDAVSVIPGETTGLRRLPTERLYEGP